MSTIEEQKKATVAKLEALERVSLDHKALLASIEEVDVVALITAHIKDKATKIENYAKKHSIDFKIDLDSLVAKVKLPIETQPAVQQYPHGLPFNILAGATVEDINWDTYKWDGFTWLHPDNWEESWESSQNC